MTLTLAAKTTLLLLGFGSSDVAMAGKKQKKTKKTKSKKSSSGGGGGIHKGCRTIYIDGTNVMFLGGDGTNKGSRALWSDLPVSNYAYFPPGSPTPDTHDYLVGTSSGHCLTLTDALASVDGEGVAAREYCSMQMVFDDQYLQHQYTGTLTYEGSVNVEVELLGLEFVATDVYTYTITGGSGDYAGAKGYVKVKTKINRLTTNDEPAPSKIAEHEICFE